ncbi:MAG: glycosyltransferase family 2 protein [Janthinobacterium lividum]
MAYSTVSILIPAYNAADYIEETLKSVLAQSWPDIEIIVVDDGSKDATLAKAQQFEGEKVRVVTQANAGASAARNLAFSLARGEYIQYLDADDLLHPDKIQAQMQCLAKQPNTVLSSSAWAKFYTVPDETTLRPTAIWRDYAQPTNWLVDAWQNMVWMQPSAWLAHRTLIAAAGPWNEELTLHDDGEFFCRVLLQCSAVKFCPSAKSFYRKGLSESLSSTRSAQAILSHLSVCLLYETHLLGKLDTELTRRACANNFQRFIYEHYPLHKELREVADDHVRKLGGSTVKPISTPLFKIIDELVGWKVSKKMQDFIYQHKLNPASWRTRASR